MGAGKTAARAIDEALSGKLNENQKRTMQARESASFAMQGKYQRLFGIVPVGLLREAVLRTEAVYRPQG